MSEFEADPKIQQAADAYSRDLVDYVKRQFGVDLDGSDASIQTLERIADALHENYKKTRPTLEQIEPFYRMIGSYIGEVYRKNHNAEWGWVIQDRDRFPGMRKIPDMQRKPTLFWPWARAHNRIVNGPEDNLSDYYQYLLNIDAPAPGQ